jgi:hypothetical protein
VPELVASQRHLPTSSKGSHCQPFGLVERAPATSAVDARRPVAGSLPLAAAESSVDEERRSVADPDVAEPSAPLASVVAMTRRVVPASGGRTAVGVEGVAEVRLAEETLVRAQNSAAVIGNGDWELMIEEQESLELGSGKFAVANSTADAEGMKLGLDWWGGMVDWTRTS